MCLMIRALVFAFNLRRRNAESVSSTFLIRRLASFISEGVEEGWAVGWPKSSWDGLPDGKSEGVSDGCLKIDGWALGMLEVKNDGKPEGIEKGWAVGWSESSWDGLPDGKSEGVSDGCLKMDGWLGARNARREGWSLTRGEWSTLWQRCKIRRLSCGVLSRLYWWNLWLQDHIKCQWHFL